MKRARLLVTGGVVLMAALSTGCATTSRGSGFSLFGGGTPTSGDLYIDALHGGLIGQAKDIKPSNTDRLAALRAEYKALEAAAGGEPVTWNGSGMSGQVVAATPYQVGSQNCRQYTQTINAGGSTVTERGAACRNANGTWTPLL